GSLPRTAAEALAPRPPRPAFFVARFAGSEDLQPRPRPPRLFQWSGVSVQGASGQAPGVVVLPHVMGVGFEKDQRRDPLGIDGGIADDGRTALVPPDEHDPLTADSVEHGGEVGIDDLVDHTIYADSA